MNSHDLRDIAAATVERAEPPTVPLYRGMEDLPKSIAYCTQIGDVEVWVVRTNRGELTLGTVEIPPAVTGGTTAPRLGVWKLAGQVTASNLADSLRDCPVVVYRPGERKGGTLIVEDALSTFMGTHVPARDELCETLKDWGVPANKVEGKSPRQLFELALAIGARSLLDLIRAEAAYGPDWD